MNRSMKKYSGQAIAIIMIVLVVATVIGASLYSRMVRNRGEIVDTRESQRALEQADNILDAFISSDLGILQNILATDLVSDPDNIIEFNSISDLTTFFDDRGLTGISEITGNTNIIENEWCEDTDGSSSIETKIGYAQETDEVFYNVGDVMAINVGSITSTLAGCVATLTFTPGGNGDHLFAMKYVYRDSSGNVTPYKLEDMSLYCLDDAQVCPSVAPTDSITPPIMTTGSKLDILLDTPNLYEVRVLPLKEKLGISIQSTEQCGNNFKNYKISAKVNCKGDTREKQVIIPNANNMGYNPLFDYTIYNANGTLSPN